MQEQQKENLEALRHTLSHILMQVLEQLYGAIPAIGPAIDNGFYHDFDAKTQITEKDLKNIKREMIKIINKDLPVEHKTLPIKEAIKLLKKKKYIYTLELAKDLQKEGASEISFYQQGEFINMCKGPHLESTGKINPKAFKLTKIAGTYWKGDEKNKMIQRIYGIAFETPEELQAYEKMLEEAKKRDHRKLGKELDLFCFSDLVGPGLPMFTPKGSTIIGELQKHVEKICRDYGFQRVMTPHLAKIDLFKISGHADKFADELFHVTSDKKHEFVLKPVQCPHQTQIYASRPRSYRDLPIRYMESEKQYRAEKTGEVGGLNRVYAITVEDGHSFCRVDQVKKEVINMVKIIREFYTELGFWDKVWISLSVRDYEHPEKYIGTSKDWDTCENMLQEVSDEMNLKAIKCEGEAALYGPKLDFMFKDALGKEIQIPTVQLDFATPKKFNLVYTNEKGQEENPVMVHRAILGSYERFLVLLIEHYVGAFPFWLSPVQVKVIPVANEHQDYAKNIFEKLRQADFRVEIDNSNNNFGKKVREAKNEKIPYFIIVGNEDIEKQKLTLESRDGEPSLQISLEELLEKFKRENNNLN